VIEVLAPGPLTTVQDLGRPGWAALGVGPSGAADAPSLRLANRLVGNPEGAAALEATLGGLALRFHQPVLIALAGAPCAVTVGDRPAAMHAPLYAAPGDVLRLGVPAAGLRTYVAVHGGIDVPPVLGSRSTDVLAGIGPDPLAAGARLPVGEPDGPAPGVDVAPVPELPERPLLRVLRGPRDDWFAGAALATLCAAPYAVTADSDRIGIRLTGAALERRDDRELPSEGMVTGALQVPPDGQPVLFLADHPVTGGYPVIGVVLVADVPLAAQARPGDALRFTLV
jgi:biotin-dependent carboxylase-like uncharacterized protein